MKQKKICNLRLLTIKECKPVESKSKLRMIYETVFY